MKQLTLITGNRDKAAQLSAFLDYPIEHRSLDILEIQSLDVEEVAREKAREAYRIVGTPVVVEDTSLVFHALGALPGPFIKWFYKELGNEGLIHLLSNYDDRTATAITSLALCDGNTIVVCTGETYGTIAERAHGEHGFGWNPIFIPEGDTRTWGEMELGEIQETSMRMKAARQLKEYLSGS